jgi:hypothetical protein
LPQAAGAGRASGAGRGQPDQPATRITGRGAIVVMFSFFFAGTVVAGWVHADLLSGLAFVAGCCLAAWYTRRDALLTVVVSPPLLFVIALVITELLTSHGDTVHHTLTSAAEGTLLTLAQVAPWLFGGVIFSLIIAMIRGLPQCVRDLRAELRGDSRPWIRQRPRDPGGGR